MLTTYTARKTKENTPASIEDDIHYIHSQIHDLSFPPYISKNMPPEHRRRFKPPARPPPEIRYLPQLQPSSQAIIHTTQQTNSGAVNFLALPREVRGKIYKMVLHNKQRIIWIAPLNVGDWVREPALLCTTRQIHDEASVVEYSLNDFWFDGMPMQYDSTVLQCFFNNVRPMKASLLPHISLTFPMMDTDFLHCLKLLQENCTNLRTLGLRVSSHITQSNVQQVFLQNFTQDFGQLLAITSWNEIIILHNDRSIAAVGELI